MIHAVSRPSRITCTDLFCGAGGSSQGAEDAGISLVMAVNHWDRAIETHQTNFQEAGHDCRNISDTHPSRYPHTDILWASPECTTWSQARGKRRNFISGQYVLDGFDGDFAPLPTAAEERSRATMWDVVRFSEVHDYRAVVVENVVDIWAWHLMPVWFDAMDRLGYDHRVLWLNSQFFGVPQSRDRFYCVFWKKGNRRPDLDFRPTSWCPSCERVVAGVQSWKRAERAPAGRYRAQYVYRCSSCSTEVWPYVTPALAALNLALPSARIGDRRKPLAPATLARIRAGIDRYWTPLLMDTLRDPKYRAAEARPLATQTGRQSVALVTHLRGTHRTAIESSARPIEAPMGTVTGGGIHHAVLEPGPLYIKNFGNRGGDPGRHAGEADRKPLGTVTAEDSHSLLQPPALYVKGYGGEAKAGPMSAPVDGKPLGSITGQDHHAVLQAPLVVTNQHINRARRADGEPLPTQTSGTTTGLAQPPDAIVAVAAGNTYERGGYARVRGSDEPLYTQSATNTLGVAQRPDAFISSYYGQDTDRHVTEPMGTVTATDRHAVVEGPAIEVDDCFFRMLTPPEIGLGMAFPGEYIVTGNKREMVRQYGQGVTPPVARWIFSRIVDSLR